MEKILARQNMIKAYKRVLSNKGSCGVDGMSTDELRDFLIDHWLTIKQKLLEGNYHPSPVRRVEIPKPDGGIRCLGIPTVLDRLIQQALAQELTQIYDPIFSENSYGFRPNRSAHDAIRKAKQYINEGNKWVVDIDLEKFFDRVNHDILMERLSRKIKDQRLLKLIRRYLVSGIMINGIKINSEEGTPQGGPLSQLEDRETFISGPNIRKDINKVIERSFTEDELFLYLKDNPETVELYLSSNKYRMLLPDNLKIKYVINNKLDLEGVKAYLGNPYDF